jgi:hypothetical protein
MEIKATWPPCLRYGAPERVEAAKLAFPKGVQELVTEKVCLKVGGKKVKDDWTIHGSEGMNAMSFHVPLSSFPKTSLHEMLQDSTS